MKKLIFLLFASFLSSSGAVATEWGVLPFPLHALEAKPTDLAEAIAKSMSIPAPVNVNLLGWHDLEPKKETYDIEGRLGGFEYAAKQGMTPYFGISVINTTRRDMPDDLAELDWKDPQIVERFGKMMEAASKKLPANIPYFIIGNEVDSYFEKHPDEVDPYIAFFGKAREIVKKYYPNAKVGITVTFEGLQKDRGPIIAKAIAASDDAFFTFYPIVDLVLTPAPETPAQLDTIIAAAQGKNVILQEVGFASTPSIGSSEALQAEFFKTIIPAIKARPQIKVASIFALNDMEPKLCDMLTDYYGFASSLGFTRKLHDFLCTLGVNDAEGKPKPAWDVIVDGIRK